MRTYDKHEAIGRQIRLHDWFQSLGFGPFGGNECSKGRCHIDNKHYLLFTDGLIIYSNFRDWNDERATIVREWDYWDFNEENLEELKRLTRLPYTSREAIEDVRNWIYGNTEGNGM